MPSLSLVIPAYNEAKRLPGTIQSLARYLRSAPFEKVELIVVDDGSRDETGAAAEAAKPELDDIGTPLRVIRNGKNRGKGFSVRRGMLAAVHEWVMFSDADLSAPIAELEKLMQAATTGGHDVAIGSRAIDHSLIGIHQPWYREFVGRVFNLNVRLLTGLEIADTQCGFKLFTDRAAKQIAAKQRVERFGFDVELLYIARKLGFTIAEVPVRWNNEANSSVTLGAGLQAFGDIWRVKWHDLAGRYS